MNSSSQFLGIKITLDGSGHGRAPVMEEETRWTVFSSRNAIKTSKSLPGADCDSNHILAMRKFKIKLRKFKKAKVNPNSKRTYKNAM
ncbi:hypothetical protein PoB_007710100 [Plakobranchus ocellatus]|uniref:Uncharacterized protein n=1 Tax=Plakobranchus ocellatus TaxID=259542 RepID=A0AAV4E403_9GAST|nr:hypothetical protein PoB_007710100 [Plakobranchus ocellatus]